jgi:replicative DNA helicase
MDLDVLSVMRKRDNYEKFARFVKPSSLGQESYTIFTAMGEWFKQNPSIQEIDWGNFNAWFVLVRHAKMDKDKLTVLKDFITLLQDREPNEDALQPLIQGLATRDYAARIAEAALRITDGEYGTGFAPITDLISEHENFTGKINRLDTSIVTFSANTLRKVREPGLQWRLPELTESVGDLRKGDFLIFGKRPDSGGTTFLASEATWMGEQLSNDAPVLWLNNEEEGMKVSSRITQAAIGWTQEEMDADPDGAQHAYEDLMGGANRIILSDLAEMHVADVNKLCATYTPGLIIFDQLHKVKGFESMGEGADKQTMLANWARELAKTYAPVITVHQAGAEAHNVKWPDYDTLYGSKTGIQGEADTILMLGRKMTEGNARGLWAPKNKLSGTDRKRRNHRYEVYINADIARFESGA